MQQYKQYLQLPQTCCCHIHAAATQLYTPRSCTRRTPAPAIRPTRLHLLCASTPPHAYTCRTPAPTTRLHLPHTCICTHAPDTRMHPPHARTCHAPAPATCLYMPCAPTGHSHKSATHLHLYARAPGTRLLLPCMHVHLVWAGTRSYASHAHSSC